MVDEKIVNAADPAKIKETSKRSKLSRENEMADLKHLLSQPQGRRFVWRLLGHCKTFESVWHPSAAIHHNSGKQDVGHFILSEVLEANEDSFLQMMKEGKNG